MSINVGTAVGYLDLDTSKFKAGLKDAQSTLQIRVIVQGLDLKL